MLPDAGQEQPRTGEADVSCLKKAQIEIVGVPVRLGDHANENLVSDLSVSVRLPLAPPGA